MLHYLHMQVIARITPIDAAHFILLVKVRYLLLIRTIQVSVSVGLLKLLRSCKHCSMLIWVAPPSQTHSLMVKFFQRLHWVLTPMWSSSPPGTKCLGRQLPMHTFIIKADRAPSRLQSITTGRMWPLLQAPVTSCS